MSKSDYQLIKLFSQQATHSHNGGQDIDGASPDDDVRNGTVGHIGLGEDERRVRHHLKDDVSKILPERRR